MNKTDNRGEQLSFHKLFYEKKWNIKIPIIQRDYAQGRDSVKEIRKLFLDNLHNHLINKKNIDLDFIYGSIDSNNFKDFIPLDGQQRLTTLFLLHWYLSILDNQNEIFNDFIIDTSSENIVSRFSYETRSSAREFCDALVATKLNLKCLIDSSISKTIKNKAWYFLVWENDPTINSMLTMLDDIHNKFSDTSGLFDRLIDIDNPIVTFQFLNLNEFNLTDDLYIKMNSRGKQLTSFENFKAKFEQYISKLNLNTSIINNTTNNKRVRLDKYFSHKIDTEWADLFWTYRNINSDDDSFDDELMNFIRVIFTLQYAGDTNNPKDDINLDILLDTLVAKRLKGYSSNISYHKYESINAINKRSVIYLINSLNSIKDKNNGLNEYLDNNSFYYNENDIFIKVLNNDLNFNDRVLFHAYLKYINSNQDNQADLESWIRVVSNLVNNRVIDGSEDFSKAIKSVNKMLPYSDKILAYLVNRDNTIDFYYSRQIEEERIKANLIMKSKRWEELIKNIEKNDYFNGQIGFILEFSKILAYYEKYNHCDWTDIENEKFYNAFKNYCIKIDAITKLLVKDDNNYDYLWERAVLTKGDYLIRTTAYRRNFLSTKRNTRDYSWKRLLRLPPKNSKFEDRWEKRRLFVKEVFDDHRFDYSNVIYSLEKICKDNIDSWRSNFIKFPKLIRYCKQGYINYKSPNNILLLKESQRNHYHSELYSYLFYFKHLEEKRFEPFKRTFYNAVKTRKEHSSAVIDKWLFKNAHYCIDIRFLAEEKKYEISFFNRNSDTIFPEVKNIIHEYEFIPTNKYGYLSHIITLNNEDETIKLCNTLSKRFMTISKRN